MSKHQVLQPSTKTNMVPGQSCMKRTKSFGLQGSTGVTFAPNKKFCSSPSLARRNSTCIAALYTASSSSEEDANDDSADDESYANNQRKARKRAFSIKQRSASFVDNRLSHAISKYSDVDEDDNDDVKSDHTSVSAIGSPHNQTRLLTRSSGSFEVRRDSISSTQLFFNDTKITGKKSPLDLDKASRNRCFEYLVGAIDEAWARYCDATSYAEDEALNNASYMPNTPASLGLSDSDDDKSDIDNAEVDADDDDVEEGYKSASTNLTEYDSDIDQPKKIGSQTSSVKLQLLKDRLLKAKYYLQDYLDTVDEEEATIFWKRWDLVKYATIELVEDDDDDEVIESTIEDLEKGRLYG